MRIFMRRQRVLLAHAERLLQGGAVGRTVGRYGDDLVGYHQREELHRDRRQHDGPMEHERRSIQRGHWFQPITHDLALTTYTSIAKDLDILSPDYIRYLTVDIVPVFKEQ